ncbi:MAG: hypothetical protein U5P41_08205 [Gammaproteobacteria bacterium]|nr:hypothetical protein [Gammaproteobacteria bacterium]
MQSFLIIFHLRVFAFIRGKIIQHAPRLSRSRHVGDLMQRELAPESSSMSHWANRMNRLPGSLPIAKADVSPDLSYAKIYVTQLDENVDQNRRC